MGRIAKRFQVEIESLAADVAEIVEEGGSDSQVQPLVLDLIDKAEKRVVAGEMASSTLIKGYLPYLWKEIGEAIGATTRSARTRLFSIDLNSHEPLGLVESVNTRRQADNHGYDQLTIAKLSQKCPINNEIWDALNEMFSSWLATGGETQNERIARLTFAISFFTGRRPWSEVALKGEFEVVTRPVRRDWKIADKSNSEYLTDFDLKSEPWEEADWCDGWLKFGGNAKPTLKEKLCGKSIPLDLPINGVAPEDIVEAVGELRELESDRAWFEPYKENQDSLIRSILQNHISKCEKDVREVVAPIAEAGHRFPPIRQVDNGVFIPYHLRPMWAAKSGYLIRQLTEMKVDQLVITKWLLGHGGGLGKASIAYQSFDYLGDAAIPKS